MCCTLQPARLSNTIIYAGHAVRDGQDVAVIAYQNKARSAGPNAMILPIPTEVPLGPANIVDTRGARWFLEDLDAASRQQSRSMMKGGPSFGAVAVQVFDSGSYTVVLAHDASAIPEALGQVPEAKRPRIDPSFFADYAKLYPGWPIAVCCWAGGTIEAEPLLWWYVPKFPGYLFFPTVDAHNGAAPIEGAVRVDHTLIWGSKTGSYKPRFRDPLPSTIEQLLAPTMHASRPNGELPNGDYWIREGGRLQRVFPTQWDPRP